MGYWMMEVGGAPRRCLEVGEVSERSRSGMPESLEVKAMVPEARAEMGRVEGAMVAVMVSITST